MFIVLAIAVGALVALILLVTCAIHQVWLLICQVWSDARAPSANRETSSEASGRRQQDDPLM